MSQVGESLPLTRRWNSARVARRQRGALYMMLLGMLAVMGVAAMQIGPSRTLLEQQAREVELLFIGDQYRRAIESYAASTPLGMARYPMTLQDLLNDTRQPALKRHLRKPFHDPITGDREWGIVALQDGRIRGVYSKSAATPLKVAGFPEAYAGFADAETYQDWKFTSRLP